VNDRDTLRLRAENFRSMAYASRDKNVRLTLLEAARELDAQASKDERGLDDGPITVIRGR
jgi:hypothetical protein